QYDRDPYIVVTDDGRLQWMLDGYTTTDRYPYSDPVRGLGNYIRNSVKAVIDAYHGTVTFYIADATDPIVRAYARAFPGLLKPLSEMPADLQRHIRYPEDFFTIQARKYATYHMLDPQVFYNKEDLWAVPRRTVEGREREMEPYYTIMRLPGEAREEFILLTLFNPARRDNMIAWLAARSDPGHYGRLIAYNFPKQKLVYGPRQIPAALAVESAGLDGHPRLAPGHPDRPVADLRAAALPGGLRAGRTPRAPSRHRRLRQPDRDGGHARTVAGADLRRPAGADG